MAGGQDRQVAGWRVTRSRPARQPHPPVQPFENRQPNFVTSAASASDFPRDGLPEVALVGRSNVGKSSLINALVRQRVARTSAAPGKTRLANIYRVARGGVARRSTWWICRATATRAAVDRLGATEPAFGERGRTSAIVGRRSSARRPRCCSWTRGIPGWRATARPGSGCSDAVGDARGGGDQDRQARARRTDPRAERTRIRV